MSITIHTTHVSTIFKHCHHYMDVNCHPTFQYPGLHTGTERYSHSCGSTVKTGSNGTAVIKLVVLTQLSLFDQNMVIEQLWHHWPQTGGTCTAVVLWPIWHWHSCGQSNWRTVAVAHLTDTNHLHAPLWTRLSVTARCMQTRIQPANDSDQPLQYWLCGLLNKPCCSLASSWHSTPHLVYLQ